LASFFPPSLDLFSDEQRTFFAKAFVIELIDINESNNSTLLTEGLSLAA